MALEIVVLAKQEPDTANITGDAMKEDGTVNRQALPAVFNPEDLHALELALEIKERRGGTVTVITMGPPAAAEILRQSLYRGADRVALVTDRRAAASDTLATSYILSCAVRHAGDVDLVMCGRQAIDGDTAQVGPQTAEKLGIPQVTYVDSVREMSGDSITLTRSTDYAEETLKAPLPVLLTVTDAAPEPRWPALKRVMKYKKARTRTEAEAEGRPAGEGDLLIPEWDLDTIAADPQRCGLAGSPTKVKRIQAIVLTGGEHRAVEPTREGVEGLVHELIEDHAIG